MRQVWNAVPPLARLLARTDHSSGCFLSLTQLDAFLAHARQQPELALRLQQPLDLEELLQIAQSEGFSVQEQDVIEAQLREEEHLSDLELQHRAGEEARRLRSFIPG